MLGMRVASADCLISLAVVAHVFCAKKRRLMHSHASINLDALARINQSPRSLKKVLSELAESLDLTPRLTTLKRTWRRAGLSWKRIRRSLKYLLPKANGLMY